MTTCSQKEHQNTPPHVEVTNNQHHIWA